MDNYFFKCGQRGNVCLVMIFISSGKKTTGTKKNGRKEICNFDSRQINTEDLRFIVLDKFLVAHL